MSLECLRGSEHSGAAPFLLLTYLTMSTVLFLNMLIAMMAKTFDRVFDGAGPRSSGTSPICSSGCSRRFDGSSGADSIGKISARSPTNRQRRATSARPSRVKTGRAHASRGARQL